MATITEKMGSTARNVGGTLGARARDVGGTVGARARDVGGTIGSRARGAGEALGTRARELQDVAAPKARQVSRAVGRRTKETRRRVGYWIAGEKPREGRTALALGAAATGAAVAFFLDPTHGKRRRQIAADWTLARIRGAGRRTARAGRGVGARAEGLRQRVLHLGDADATTMNDPTLEQKVQSELFQGLDLPSKEISIMVANGVVSLRGTVARPDLVATIERRVRGIDGVRDVENQLRFEGAPAPTTR